MKRYPGLDLLRALAIAWVMLFHGLIAGLGTPSAAIAQRGWMGVDLFFALSGYLIGSQLLQAYAQGEPPSAAAFYRRRALRIFPAYLAVLALYVAAPALREDPLLAPLWQFLTFTENLCVNFSRDRAFSHAWSLCVEEHFYLVFPLLVWWLMRRPSWRKTAAVCLGVLGMGLFLRAYIWLEVFRPAVLARPRLIEPVVYYMQVIFFPTYLRMDGLLAGVAVAAIRWFRPALWAKAMAHGTWLLLSGLAAVAGAIRLFLPNTIDFWPAVFGYPLMDVGMALVVAGSLSPQCPIGRLRVPGARLIATLSYGLYLTHKVTFHLVQTYLPSWVAGGGFQAFAVYALAALSVAAVLYGLVERPFLAWRRRLDARAA